MNNEYGYFFIVFWFRIPTIQTIQTLKIESKILFKFLTYYLGICFFYGILFKVEIETFE